MLPKAFVVLAINALLAETYVLRATDHHKTCHATKWRSHGWEKMGERTAHWCAISSDYMKSFI